VWFLARSNSELPEDLDSSLDLRSIGALDDARHHVGGDGIAVGEGKDQVGDDRSEADHFGEQGLLGGSACRLAGELEDDVATPFAERLLTGFGQTPEAIEVGIGDPECDGSGPERRALAHQRPHYPPYQRVYIC